MTNNPLPAAPTCRCPICGKEVVRERRPGRPTDYCGDLCRETSKLLGRLTSHLDQLGEQMDNDGVRAVRRRVWSMVNATLNGKRKTSAVSSASTVDAGVTVGA